MPAMTNLKINLKRTGGIIPDGVYKARIENAEIKQGQKAPYIALRLKLEGWTSTIFSNVTLSPDARFLLEPFLDAIQAPEEGSLTPAKLLSLCRNKAVYVRLGNKEYDGKVRNEIQSYLTPEVGKKLAGEKPAAPAEEEDDDEEADFEDEDDEGDEEYDDDGDDDDTAVEGRGDNLPF